jgi:hypothetical protein
MSNVWLARGQPFVKVYDVSALATCYAEPNGRVRPKTALRTDVYRLGQNVCSPVSLF